MVFIMPLNEYRIAVDVDFKAGTIDPESESMKEVLTMVLDDPSRLKACTVRKQYLLTVTAASEKEAVDYVTEYTTKELYYPAMEEFSISPVISLVKTSEGAEATSPSS